MYPVLYLVLAGSAEVLFIIHLLFLRKWNRILKRISSDYGLKFSKGNVIRPVRLKGENSNSRLYISLKSFFNGKFLNKNTLSFSCRFCNDNIKAFSIVMETTLSRFHKKISGNDLLTGDPVFDDLVYLKADSGFTAFAYLGYESRRIIIDLIKDSYRQLFSIYDGELRAVFGVSRRNGYDDVVCQLDRINRLAELFCRTPVLTDTEKKKRNREKTEEFLLRENYKTEPYIPVKINQLNMIYSRNKRVKANDEIAKDALGSDHVRLKYLGAKILGKKGYRYMPEIFSQSSDKLKKEILEYLIKAETDCFLDYFLTAGSCLNYGVREFVYRYIKMTADPSAEDFLISELEQDEFSSGPAARACIEALGVCGSLKAVAVLDKRRHYREVGQAIARIQERVETGDSGWLTLEKPDEEEGSLSLEDKD